MDAMEKVHDLPHQVEYYHNFYNILIDAEKKNILYDLSKDIKYLDFAIFSELDSISKILRTLCFQESQVNTRSEEIYVPASKLFEIQALILVTGSRTLLSRQFEYFNFEKNSWTSENHLRNWIGVSTVNPKIHQLGNNYLLLFSDFYDSGLNVITVWDKKDSLFQFKALLDKIVGGHQVIDTTFAVKNRSVIIGTQSEGDCEGNNFVEVWIAQWVPPRKFLVIHTEKWESYDGDSEMLYFITDTGIRFKTVSMKLDENQSSNRKTYNLVSEKVIPWDSLFKKSSSNVLSK